MNDNKHTQSTQQEAENTMLGADVLVRALEREQVRVIFAYPGGSSIELHQALCRPTTIRTILPRFEQGGGFMAHGYARSTGKPAVCMCTSGPGATNLVTCIADAYMDSIPLIAITGQVYQQFIGKTAFQETDFFGITLPVVKHSFLVLNAEELPQIVKKAFRIATTGRPGPVVIDIPKDVQQKKINPVFPSHVDFPGLQGPVKATDDELNTVLQLIEKAKRPVLYTGGGIISGNAEKELLDFVQLTGLPVATTLMGIGALPEEHKQSLRWFGMHGTVVGNWAVADSDLLIAAATRFDDRITGAVNQFATHATIVHIDIDKTEHQKNKEVLYPIHSDIQYAFRRMCELAKENNFKKPDLSAWENTLQKWKQEHPFTYDESPHILPQQAIETLYEETKGDAIITTGVGQHQMWAAQFYKFNQPRRYISSLGLGTMGFGLPSALGAKIANPDSQVVDIDGDGSFLMNIQELATAVVEKINVKILLINNQHLGMVMQWEDLFYQGVRGQTILGHLDNIGGPENPQALYPDFVKIAQGFGVKARQIIKKEELRPAISEMLAYDQGPYLLEVIIPSTEHVLPMIQQGKSAKEILLKT
jgi:acetolactate synthase I/II/III large subunit